MELSLLKQIPKDILTELEKRGIKNLEEFQVEAIKKGVLEGENLLVCAPTSSGKTLIGELALVKKAYSSRGCFYVVSHKALAEEKYRLFSTTYEANNYFNIAITTGDHTRFDDDLGSYGIIITTYEKFSQLLISKPDLISLVSLVVVDEAQILGDVNRGPNLETLLIKLK